MVSKTSRVFSPGTSLGSIDTLTPKGALPHSPRQRRISARSAPDSGKLAAVMKPIIPLHAAAAT